MDIVDRHNCMVSRPGLSNEDLVKLADDARMRFYFRPKYILNRLKVSIKNPDEAKRIAKSGKTFLSYLFKMTENKIRSKSDGRNK